MILNQSDWVLQTLQSVLWRDCYRQWPLPFHHWTFQRVGYGCVPATCLRVSKPPLYLLVLILCLLLFIRFSECVTHLRFTAQLFSEFPSLWSTQGLSSGFGHHSLATSLWMYFCPFIFSSLYPLLDKPVFSMRLCFRCLILPLLLTS